MHSKEILVRDPGSANIWVTLMLLYINTSCNLNLWAMETGKLHGLSGGAVSGYFLTIPRNCVGAEC